MYAGGKNMDINIVNRYQASGDSLSIFSTVENWLRSRSGSFFILGWYNNFSRTIITLQSAVDYYTVTLPSVVVSEIGLYMAVVVTAEIWKMSLSVETIFAIVNNCSQWCVNRKWCLIP